jgi:hypothetical protein
MPTRYKVALFLITFLFIFLLKPTSSYAAELDHPPVVTSLTGPTTGYYGQTYNFTVTGTSADGYTITTLYLQDDGNTFSSRSAGDSGCTGTACTFTGSFTPPTTGTFVIHAASAYTNGVNSDTCNTYSGDAVMDCQNSGDKYITLTILAAPTTPIVESITGPTTGAIGSTYNFSAVLSSTASLPIGTVSMAYLHPDGNVRYSPSSCESDTACAPSFSLTPSVAGTYRIYAFLYYQSGGENYYCTSNPIVSPVCSYSSTRYIDFVVPAVGGQGGGDEDLPDAGILSNQTRNIIIGLGFISLGILTTQTTRIMNILGLTVEKKKSRWEKRFE